MSAISTSVSRHAKRIIKEFAMRFAFALAVGGLMVYFDVADKELLSRWEVQLGFVLIVAWSCILDELHRWERS